MSTLLFAAPALAGPTIKYLNQDNFVNPVFESDPGLAMQKAREYIAAGHMVAAIHYMEGYVEAYPDVIATRRFLGDLYFRVSDFSRAIAEYQIILQHAPQDKETHNRLGTVYAVQNRVDDAIAQFNSALPGTDSVEDLVVLHERKGDFDKYRSQMERAARDFPSDPDMQSELAQIYNAIHEPYAAAMYFKRALDIDPANLTSRNGLGLAYLNMRDYAGAQTQFQMCLKADPTAYLCEDNLAAAQLEARDLADAKVSLDRAFHLRPERAETLVNYGYLADVQGDWQKAVSYYARSIETFPYLREAYIDLAIAYEDHKLYTLAQAALIKGLASVPDDGRMHFLLAKAYEGQGNEKDALAQYRIASEGTDPDASRIAKSEFSSRLTTPQPSPGQ